LDLRNSPKLDAIIDELVAARIIYVGERHDSYADHLKQLEIIRKIHAIHPDLAIGMEQFQRPFQQVLDGYVAGELSEQQLLLKSEWYDRWRFDYRLYRPILTFAQEHTIPVVALNVAKEITSKVSKGGMESLSLEEKGQIPATIEPPEKEYRDWLYETFKQHPHADEQQFERFLQVQLLWDEGMAKAVAEHLQNHPGRKMVVLAGSGHLMFGAGIPDRASKRLPDKRVIVLPADAVPAEPGIADFLLFSGDEQLPPAGLMGIMLADSKHGVVVKEVIPESAAAESGVERDDLIVAVDGAKVTTAAEVRVLLLDRKPGDRIQLNIQRKKLMLLKKELLLDLMLKEPEKK
jgi:uncharacterized iron-regulated protein